jgi:hypothetical protein
MKKIVNTYLLVKSWIRYILNTPPKYDRVEWDVIDRFTNLNNWNIAFWWGRYSETEDTAYVSGNNVILLKSGLLLDYQYQEKINRHNNKMMSWSHGCIEHKDVFGKGIYEVEFELIEGKGVWHAPLWFVTKGNGKEEFTVMPEIDVCEIFEEKKMQSNIHYGREYNTPEHYTIGGMTHRLRNVYGRTIRVGMKWDDKISIYYDGHLVRVITDGEILGKLNLLMPIIGAGVLKNREVKHGGGIVVKSFKYKALTT